MADTNTRLNALSSAPIVCETPLDIFSEDTIPNEDFFVRNHFPHPEVDTNKWRLSISGLVGQEKTYTYQELLDLPTTTISTTVECAGNGRASVQPPPEGLLWNNGGVGSAVWSGVSVKSILEDVGLSSNAAEILFLGMDFGQEGQNSAEANYGMSIPVEKALDPDTILATKMNGEVLPPAHGYPIRCVVPGWYGMAQVKWVNEIRVLDKPHDGFHQKDYYVFVKPGVDDGLDKERVSYMRVKSLISSLRRGQTLNRGTHVIQGTAWSGKGNITKVEISTDGGRNWDVADVSPSTSTYEWHKWQYNWNAVEKGWFVVMVRATDETGDVQPQHFEWNFRGFANNSIHSLPIIIA